MIKVKHEEHKDREMHECGRRGRLEVGFVGEKTNHEEESSSGYGKISKVKTKKIGF